MSDRVARHRRQLDPGSQQGARELAGPVGPEVEVDHRVAGLDPRRALDHGRLDELVGNSRLVARPDRVERGVGVRAEPEHQGVHRLLRPLVAVVAIHGPVSARDRRDPVLRQGGEVFERCVRRDVTTVGEGVNPGVRGREREEGSEVVDVRMDAALRHEPDQVDAPATREGRLQRLVLAERAVGHGLVHANEVLVQASPRSEGQVPHLGVAHLPCRDAHGLAGGLERRMRIAREQIVEDGRLGERDGVAGPRRGAAPPVGNHERYEWDASRQIVANDSRSSDAPPTSAPSTSGCAASSAALSGLTEPP